MVVLWSYAAAFLFPMHTSEGTWVLRSIYRTSNVQGPSSSEQRKLIGSKMVITARHIRACGQSILIRSRSSRKVNAEKFLFGSHARFYEVGIKGPTVTEVVYNDGAAGSCFDAFPTPGQRLYIKSRDELLVDFAGAFYRAVRVN